MAEPLKPNWLKLHCLPFREIMQYVASESLEDLSNCRLACKTWNDQIIGNNIWKQKIVKLMKNWDVGKPKYSRNVMNFDQEIKGSWAANGDTYAIVTSGHIAVSHGVNYDRKWSLRYEKNERITSIQVTKDVIAFVTRTYPPIYSSGTRRLNVYDIKTHSKLMSLELKSEQFLSEGSLILLYNMKDNLRLLKDVKVIDVYDQNSSFTYTPKKLKIDCFLSLKNSTVMSFFQEIDHFPLQDKPNKVTIFEVRTKDRIILRKYIIRTDRTDYGIPLGGFLSEPIFFLLYKNHISVFNVDGHFVRRIQLPVPRPRSRLSRSRYPVHYPKWYFDYGRLAVAKFDAPYVHVWKIEDLASKDGKPRALAYRDGGYRGVGVSPVINRECVKIHLLNPRGRKAEWLKMKF